MWDWLRCKFGTHDGEWVGRFWMCRRKGCGYIDT